MSYTNVACQRGDEKTKKKQPKWLNQDSQMFDESRGERVAPLALGFIDLICPERKCPESETAAHAAQLLPFAIATHGPVHHVLQHAAIYIFFISFLSFTKRNRKRGSLKLQLCVKRVHLTLRSLLLLLLAVRSCSLFFLLDLHSCGSGKNKDSSGAFPRRSRRFEVQHCIKLIARPSQSGWRTSS